MRANVELHGRGVKLADSDCDARTHSDTLIQMVRIHIEVPDDIAERDTACARQLGYATLPDYYSAMLADPSAQDALPDDVEQMLIARLERNNFVEHTPELAAEWKRKWLAGFEQGTSES